MYLIYQLLSACISAYELALLIYVILSWIRPSANRWTELLRSVVEPPLRPIRSFVMRHIPLRWQFLDWSVLVMWFLLDLAKNLLWRIFF